VIHLIFRKGKSSVGVGIKAFHEFLKRTVFVLLFAVGLFVGFIVRGISC
jgi:hypothetical protein